MLSLGWALYADVLELGHEVWVYFHGPGVSERGVYAKGFVHTVDLDQRRVLLRLREFDTEAPLTDPATSARIAEIVRPRGRQVFVAPEELEPVPQCTLASCAARACDRCPRWQTIPVIYPDQYRRPGRLTGVESFVPACWVVPARCFLYRNGRGTLPGIEAGSRMFYAFKSGERSYAYPLARAMYEALHRRGDLAGAVAQWITCRSGTESVA